jgi:CDP-diacylglycerol---serine O-phosphatidyltransferase
MKQIPNLFTLLNLCCGFVAIILILQTGESIVNLQDGAWQIFLPERIWWASVFIGVAAIIDFLDGFVARLFNATSEMGKQLDSLADVVTFGVAPGLILFQLLRISYAQEADGMDTAMGWLLPTIFFPMAAAWRLARFNIDTTQRQGFEGVPTPAAGLLIASFPLLLLYNNYNIQSVLLNKWVLYVIILLVSWLMVSRLPLLNLKFKSWGLVGNKARYLLISLSVLSIPFLGWLAVPFIFFSYIAVSLLFKNKTT